MLFSLRKEVEKYGLRKVAVNRLAPGLRKERGEDLPSEKEIRAMMKILKTECGPGVQKRPVMPSTPQWGCVAV